MKTTIKYLLVLVLAGFVFTGCAMNHCGSPKAQQWEYKVIVYSSGGQDLEMLNEQGKDGWMLVSTIPHSGGNGMVTESEYIFKRLKQ